MLRNLTAYVGAHIPGQVVRTVVRGGGAEVLGELGREGGYHRSNAASLAALGSVVDVKAHEHGVFQGQFQGPWLSAQFGVHLNYDLGRDAHQALGNHIFRQKTLTGNALVHS